MRGTLGPLVPVAAVVVVAAVAHTAARGVEDVWVAVAFTAFVAFGELVRLTLPGERDAAPLAVAGALAYCLLPEVAGTPAGHNASQVIAVTAIGILIGGLPHAAAGRVVGLEDAARRLLVVAAAAAAFRPVVDPAGADLDTGPGLAAVMIVVLLGAGALDALLAALTRAHADRSRLRNTWRDELRTELSIGSAIGATGMLIALAVGVMDLWAIPVFCAPLLLTQFSFRRFVAIRETYLQTIRSLSRVTELGGYTETGHARRVSELALAVGRELGMIADDLRDLEYAALMHDLGQLSLSEPIPGGATIMVDPGEQRRIAEEGARVIRATGVLDRVADLVALSTEPYRRPHEALDPTLPVGASVIKAANAFDDLVGESGSPQRRLDALERLRLGMAYEYDPRVVAALSRVVERSMPRGA